jgi:hypothetical protein
LLGFLAGRVETERSNHQGKFCGCPAACRASSCVTRSFRPVLNRAWSKVCIPS